MKKKKTIVIKIGTNVLTTDDGKLDLNSLRNLIHQIANCYKDISYQFIIVTSGAITCGSEELGITPKSIPERQAAASIGQIMLMQEYTQFFGFKNIKIGQILVTKENLASHIHQTNIINTISMLSKQGIIPVINENDSVATDEINDQFSDNDALSCQVAKLISATKLIILTDIDGIYTENPKKNKHASLITSLDKITDTIMQYADDKQKNVRSRGGMTSKIISAKHASEAGIEVVIANGRKKNILLDILDNQAIGTKISAQKG